MGHTGNERLLVMLGGIDRINEWMGKIYSWILVPLTVMVTFEVVSRYVLNRPHAFVTELAFYMYGSLAILVAGYTLRHGGHVGVDIFESRFSPRTKFVVQTITFLVFFVPFVGLLIPAATDMTIKSFASHERSVFAMLPLTPYFKACLPIGLTLLLLQGVADFARSIASWAATRRDS